MQKSSGKGWELRWNGQEVSNRVLDTVLIPAFSDFALDVEGTSKRQLKPGAGKLTGTLQRSIHAADPDYKWSQDDIPPVRGSAEKGGRKVLAVRKGKTIIILVGSGLRYALPVHQGHGSYAGIPYLKNGLGAAQGRLKRHIERYSVK
jgi:hypothetical protein